MLVSAEERTTTMWIKGFIKTRSSHTYITKTLDGLATLGYIDKVRGGWRDPITGTSETSRYRATKTLTKLFTEYGFNQQSIIKDKTAVAVRLRGKKPKRTKKNKKS